VGLGSREGEEKLVSLSAMYPHRIRLRGPWECERVDGEAPLIPLPGGEGSKPHSLAEKEGDKKRVILPCRWLDAGFGDYHGVACFTRKFGYPGRVDETEHVWLTCAGCTGGREVRLNGHLIAQNVGAVFAFDVTAILLPRNRLDVYIQGDTHEAGLWGEVALEIRKDAYLADLQIERSASALYLLGHAVGTAPQPLELYVLVDGKHVDYRTIVPTAEGTSFRIELVDAGPTPQTVRAELINVSSIWYVAELPIPPWKLA
jgi:hypothetical protein